MSRQQRRRSERSAARSPRRKRSIGFPLVMLAVVLGGGALIVMSLQERSKPIPPPKGVQTFEDLARDHTQGPVEYEQTPPVGGKHAPPPQWQNCGFYSHPVASENAVHSLEHSAVWITYAADLPKAQVDIIRGIARGSSLVLASVWPEGLPSPVVASAWGKQLKLPSASDDRLQRFVQVYAGSPDAPEPRGACSGGVGEPE